MLKSEETVFVGLVHNNQTVRNQYVTPRIEDMCHAIGASFRSVSWQPVRQQHTYWVSLRRDFHYLVLGYRWVQYRQLPFLMPLRVIKGELGRFKKYIFGGRRLSVWRDMSFIETAVTAKHVLLWQLFLESDARYIICYEDDLVFREDSVKRLTDLISDLAREGRDLLYCDLAGGLDIQTLGVDQLVESHTGDRVVYSHPTTNTACSYLLSRDLAAEFMRQISLRPSLRLVGIDWMMNAMFIDLRRRQVCCHAIHSKPTIFSHGTFTSDYVSWQEDATFKL